MIPNIDLQTKSAIPGGTITPYQLIKGRQRTVTGCVTSLPSPVHSCPSSFPNVSDAETKERRRP